jgi:hypothetical protein
MAPITFHTVALHSIRFFRTFDAASNQQNPKQPMPINNLETHWQKLSRCTQIADLFPFLFNIVRDFTAKSLH